MYLSELAGNPACVDAMVVWIGPTAVFRKRHAITEDPGSEVAVLRHYCILWVAGKKKKENKKQEVVRERPFKVAECCGLTVVHIPSRLFVLDKLNRRET